MRPQTTHLRRAGLAALALLLALISLIPANDVSAQGKPYTVYYGYCPPGSDCLNPASWQTVALAKNVDHVQLELTPDGKPRLLYLQVTSSIDRGEYHYAACDSRCGEAASWRAVAVATTAKNNTLDYDLPQRSFALDRLCRPRFIYVTGALGDPREGAFYATCDANCTSTASWQEGGRDGDGDILIYGWCAAECLSEKSWEGRTIGVPQHQGETPDLELDNRGRPRKQHISTAEAQRTQRIGRICATLRALWWMDSVSGGKGAPVWAPRSLQPPPLSH